MTTQAPDISIVICFRDWGLDRLEAAVRSHYLNAEIAGINVEVVVSDYGSSAPDTVKTALETTSCRVVHTPVDGPWNRSASLNAGVVAARGKWIITTDADIVFTPETMPALLAAASKYPDALYLIQCRDLPEGYKASRISALLDSSNWADGIRTAFREARIRPRWGMGGFAAFHATAYSTLNGYEERMKVWGGEDNDFATRMRRAGFPIRWLSKPEVGILHIWHEPSQKAAIQTEEGKLAVESNRSILRNDMTIVRNLPAVKSVGSDEKPVVTIIVPTYKRPELLRQCIQSCINQTYASWNMLVVENGDSEGAQAVVDAFDDQRLQYLRCEKKGAAAARNLGLDHANGRYIVIQDDDDMMVSTRIEDHLRALEGGDCGTYSGWIDFDSCDFSVMDHHPGKEFSHEAVLCNGKVLTHGALMLDRRVFSRFRYFEHLSAGIDYGFILLLARNGLKLKHTGRYGILRRIHGHNMTAVDSAAQKSAAVEMAEIVKSEIAGSDYNEFRRRGLEAGLLKCSNEEQAITELSAWKQVESRRQPIIIDDSIVGVTLSAIISSRAQVAKVIEAARREGRQVEVDATNISTMGATYLRLLIAAANLGRREFDLQTKVP